MASRIGFILRVIATTLLLALCTRFAPGQHGDSVSTVLGFPVVSIRADKALGVIALGQSAFGVIALGQLAVGLIAVGQVGASVLFGVGQAMVGLLAIAQVGVGVFFFLGQLGPGLFCIGQVVFGYAGIGQVPVVVRRGRELLSALGGEVGEALEPWPRPRRREA